MPPSNDERGPRTRTALHVDTNDSAHSTAPSCWICGRALYAKESVRLGIGPRCWSGRMGGAA